VRRVMLSCLAQASTAALVALVLAGAARADTIKDFFVSGTATNVSGGMLGSCAAEATCSFSGTMMVDVTSGILETVHITFPGLLTFDTITGSSPHLSLTFGPF